MMSEMLPSVREGITETRTQQSQLCPWDRCTVWL